MDGRESMALSGSSSYYLHTGFSGSGSGSGSLTHTGIHRPPGFRSITNPNISVQSNVRDGNLGPTFPVESSSPNLNHGLNIGGAPSGGATGESGKRKRGRPRKYRPDGTNMSLGLSPMSSAPSAGSTAPRRRGRPPGSGRKQQLASLGEWMNSSAGMAFTPHIINIAEGEDIASKILSFSQKRPRAICILSASGAVSAVTLRQPTQSGNSVTYEGRFQILCLSGSYLVAESGGPHNRTGGLSVSLCSPDGHVIGGGVGGMLMAGSPVQVVLCSFVYGSSKSKNKEEVSPKGEQNSVILPGERSCTPTNAAFSHNLTPNSSAAAWPGSRPDLRNSETGIDLMRG
ncbi:AT-hook motif nuclear-localized protein [Actinidia chinensis var. chinensis]|uniref:AT-hook motif nuclear-localized protein n=1 Tax=Actinidia chinensis var. chinensis TaxID=1590841 RepID=A0A2R6PHY8_ACTCC|nr:AT-hook motif nuclear-localized protein [Actinidia chinensis var. chinensis]